MTQPKCLYQPVLLGLLLTTSLLALLNVGVYSAQAASGEIYCVVPHQTLSTTYPVCHQVFATIQDAVDASSGGETIRVAAGHLPGQAYQRYYRGAGNHWR